MFIKFIELTLKNAQMRRQLIKKPYSKQGSTAPSLYFPTLALSSSGSRGYPCLSHSIESNHWLIDPHPYYQLTISLFALAQDKRFSASVGSPSRNFLFMKIS